jgi:hypothetical protein
MIHETLPPINEQLIVDSPLPATAAAAKFAWPNPSKLMQQLEMRDVTLNIFEPAVTETLQLRGTHETLGLSPNSTPNVPKPSSSDNATRAPYCTKPSADGRAGSKAQSFDWSTTYPSLALINFVKY